MKNLLTGFIISAFLVACNNKPGNGTETKDSLQQLLQSFRDSIKKYPADTLLKYNLVLTLQEAGRYNEAVGLLDSLNITKGDSAELKSYFAYLYKRAELLAQGGDTTNAIQTLELYVIPGELTESGLQLANLYAETKNPKTLAVYNAMLKNDGTGKDPSADYFAGVYYYNLDDYENAIIHFSNCIKRDYTFIDAYMEKGRILYKQAKYNDAIAVYDLAITVSNSFADAHLWKGKCQEQLGQKQAAKLSYQRAYAFDKTLTEAKEAADRIKN